jgi:uracil-DNA glycosylase
MAVYLNSPKPKETWTDLEFWKSPEWENLKTFLADTTYLPEKRNVFRAFFLTPLWKTKVVILGQDPYHQPGVATGLAFSVHDKHRGKLPKSLHNIYKELRDDLRCEWPKTGDLTRWAQQGVLLLNTSLTVEPNSPESHMNLGWELLAREALEAVSKYNPKAVFVLWGNHAQGQARSLPNPRVESSHPSPLSAHRGFFGSRPFSKVNGLLALNKMPLIDWR